MTLTNSSTTIETPRAIEGLFVHKDAITLHLSAPMLEQRQTYLATLLASGRTHRYVAERATLLRHVVELIVPSDPKKISEEDIAKAAHHWVLQASPVHDQERSRRGENFKTAARSWARFLGLSIARYQPFCRFQNEYNDFVAGMHDAFGYLPASVLAAASPTKSFLLWATARHVELKTISMLDIDEFMQQGRASGWSNRTVKFKSQALRTFFRYAERRGWSFRGLSKTIKAPVVCSRTSSLQRPPWTEVRRLIGAFDTSIPTQCRAKAILLLASVYGMRSCEIAHLTLEDLDWGNEILNVRRAKRGRIQQFPLQFEVGQAIIDYLQQVRPRSKHRSVFLTLHAPYRPMEHLSQSMWRWLRTGVFANTPCGLHSLRHACATELLRRGTSLQGIADFLGHRSMRSVSIYAHCDVRSLRRIADFQLSEIL